MKYDNPNFSLTSSPTITGNILQIPLRACIIAETPELLSDKLAKEKALGEKSYYAPYINVLPSLLPVQLDDDNDNNNDREDDVQESPLNSLPRFWNDERKDLVYSADGGQMEKRLILDERKGVDDWAYACVSSRANYVLGHGFAMTPILDMINHDSSISTSAKIVASSAADNNYDEEDSDGVVGGEESLHLFINDSFSIGDEVFISYGDLTNLDTLCNYGFVSENNQCNKENVDILLMGSAPVQVSIDAKDGSIDQTSLSILRSSICVVPFVVDGGGNNDNDNDDAMDEEVYSLIASFVDEAIYNANEGAEKAMAKGDDLVTTYLRCRVDTLQKGLENIKEKFPHIEF